MNNLGYINMKIYNIKYKYLSPNNINSNEIKLF